jgi:tetratricopeptide (TPR) repeat protein
VSKRDEVLRQADAAVSAGRFAEAAAILRAHEASFPGQVDRLLELVTQLHAAENRQSAPLEELDVSALLDLPRVFDGLRAESVHDADEDEAAEQLALAQAHLELGMVEDAAKSFEAAARSPRLRFEATGALARVHRDRGDLPRAIEWFERAVETPSPDTEAGFALLYDLGATLEQAGEPARALAVFMELMAQTKKYRDVALRVARLSREATGG